MSDIFISYARSTEDTAKLVAEALRALGYGVWRDDEIPAHRAYAEVIAERLANAKAVVVIWSEEAARSQWVFSEANRAREDGKLVQLTVDGARLPMPFDSLQCADFLGWSGEDDTPGWKQVIGAVAGLVAPDSSASNTTQQPVARPDVREHSICVLPFANMSDDSEQEYFSDGISEDIITDLSKVGALSVIARNSAFAFKGKNVDVKMIARQLGVAYVLEGSVRKAGSRVRITAQLIDGARNDHLWAERWDRELTDIFDLQDEISQAIVAALKLKLLPEEKKAIERRGTASIEAYDAFLKGRELAQVQDGEGVLARAIRHLEEAVRLDPNFALAWAWLATANFFLPEHNDAPNWQSYLEAGKKAARQALNLDPNLSDAHFAMGYARLVELDLPGQWEARKRAHELDPASVPAMHELGCAYALMGLYEISYPLIEKAIADDPFSPSFTSALGLYQWVLGNRAAASASFDRSIELGFLLVAVSKAQMMAASGQRPEAYAYLMAAFKEHAEDLPPGFQSRFAQWLFSLAVTKDAGWAKALMWSSVKRNVGNPKKVSGLAFKSTLLLLEQAEAYFSEVRNRPNTYLSGALMNLWIPTESARRIRTHPGFPQFAEDIGLVRCWQIHGWPPQVQPNPGTDGSNLQFTCR
jgi:adenylate cyclase